MRRSIILVLIIIAYSAYADYTIRVGDLDVSVYSRDWRNMQYQSRAPITFKEWTFRNIYNMYVDPGYEYSIRFENKSNRRVAVFAYIDGLNSLDRDTEKGRAWVIEPGNSFDLSGWQIGNQFQSNFVFVNIGSPSGQGGQYPGWIFIAQYREAIPEGRYTAMFCYRAPAGLETGAGKVERHETYDVPFNFEQYPTGLAAINYIPSSPQQSTYQRSGCTPYLGVATRSNINDGVLIESVQYNSPAYYAGFEAGDVIRYFNGERTRNNEDLLSALYRCYEGQQVYLEFVNVRDGRIYQKSVTVGCK